MISPEPALATLLPNRRARGVDGHPRGGWTARQRQAVVAVAEDDKGSMWIASASLDRYLIAIGQKQVFGTQFTAAKVGPDRFWT